MATIIGKYRNNAKTEIKWDNSKSLWPNKQLHLIKCHVACLTWLSTFTSSNCSVQMVFIYRSHHQDNAWPWCRWSFDKFVSFLKVHNWTKQIISFEACRNHLPNGLTTTVCQKNERIPIIWNYYNLSKSGQEESLEWHIPAYRTRVKISINSTCMSSHTITVFCKCTN